MRAADGSPVLGLVSPPAPARSAPDQPRSSAPLPRTSPRSIRRARFERWLAENEGYALRFAAAAPGTGKTTAAVEYARANAGRVWYVSVAAAAPPAALFRRLAANAGAADAATYDDVLDLMRRHAEALEIVVDDVDQASADVVGVLDQLVTDVPPHVSLIYLARARRRFELARHIVNGLASVAPADLFDFDDDDVRALATAHGVAVGEDDVAFLRESSDGWALVVAGAMRTAASTKATLPDAFLEWMDSHRGTLRDFTTAVLSAANAGDPDQLFATLAAPAPEDAELLSSLEERGLFVRRAEDGLRPYRVMTAFQRDAAPVEGNQPLVLAMFGRFRSTIGGRAIVWLRRREQQIVEYLALTRTGGAERDELIALFWPDTSPSLAQQSLRTACSNIRKAFATVVGQDAVEQYFERRGAIELRVENVVADVRRFREHVIAGETALRADDRQQAFAHYAAAERLFTMPLLAGEPCGPPFDAYAGMFDEALAVVLDRLVELARERNDLDLARTYAERLRRHAQERVERPQTEAAQLESMFAIRPRDTKRRSA
ncbi:MAG TPA: AAA family ATPase [Candidatus Baltobacteraceae bacterium]|nr:AAA family ATPase [Candidatus Baltobacteraceae bacterium]